MHFDVKKLFLNIFSERFLVTISKEGFSNYIETLHKNCTIFTVSFTFSNCLVS